MAKRCIGIDIGSTYISAVQIVRSAEQFHIEKSFRAKMRRNTDSPVFHLKQLFGRNGFDTNANVAISIPNIKVFFRRLQTNVSGSEHISEHSHSILKQEFPFQEEELVMQSPQKHTTAESGPAMVAAAKKGSLSELLDTVAEASIYPDLVDAAIFAAYSAVKVNHPEIAYGNNIIAHIDEVNLTIAVVENGNIVLVRSLPFVPKESDLKQIADELTSVLHQEVEVTWHRLYDTGIEQETKIYLLPPCSVNNDILPLLEQKLACQVTIPDPCRMVERSDDCTIDATILTAEGLALRLLAPEQTSGINFLEATDFEADPMPAIRKNAFICAVLGAAIVVFLVLGLFARLSFLEKKNIFIKGEMKEIFKNTLPGETAIIEPLAQLEQKLKPLQADYSKFAPFSAGTDKPLEVLRDISFSTPLESNIKVNNILITNKSARLSGTSPSFKAVYDWLRLLKENPEFYAVDILDIGADTQSESVQFTILISLDSSEQS